VSYVDLIVQLQTARADAYQTVWFYQRLSRACARHGWKHRPHGNGPRTLPIAEAQSDVSVHEEAAMTADDHRSTALAGPQTGHKALARRGDRHEATAGDVAFGAPRGTFGKGRP